MSPENLKRRSDIQILRGFAVILVIAFHSSQTYFPWGYLGVDIFFVISGFVVSPMIFNSISKPSISEIRSSYRLFFATRIYRLMPALIFSLMAFSLPIFLLSPIGDTKYFLLQAIMTIFLLGNYGASKYSGDYFHPRENPFIHTWSLSLEEQIYLLFPLLSILVYLFIKKVDLQIFLRVYRLVTFFSFAMFIFGYLILSSNNSSILQNILFYSPITRIWEFSVGGLLAFYSHKRSNPKKVPPYVFLCLIVLLTIISFLQSIATNIVAVVIASLLLIEYRVLDLITPRLSRKFVRIGDFSYSLYLVHMPLIYLAKYSIVFQTSFRKDRLIQTIVAVFLTFILGRWMFTNIEDRFRIRKTSNIRVEILSLRAFFVFILMPNLLLTSLYTFDERASFPSVFNKGIRSSNWDSGCSMDTYLVPCKYTSRNATSNILLLGDSQAASLSKLLNDLRKEYGYNIFVYSRFGCPFLLNYRGIEDIVDRKGADESCLNHNRNTKALIESYRINRVIYFGITSSMRLKDQLNSPKKNENRANRISEKILSDLDTLAIPNSRITVFGFIPILKNSQVTHFSLLFGEEIRFSEAPKIDNVRWEILSKSKGFKFFDSYTLICPKWPCLAKAGNRYFYDDENHLSITGLSLLRSKIQEVLLDSSF